MNSTSTARSQSRLLSRLRARRLMDRYACRLAPALAAGLIGLHHLPDPILAAVLAIGTFAAATLVGRASLPLHLLPTARVVLALCSPLVGAAAVLAVAAYGGHQVAFGMLGTSIIGAWLVFALGIWAQTRFERENPLRMALIGTPAIAAAFSRELEAAELPGYRIAATVSPALAQAAEQNVGETSNGIGPSELDRLLASGSVDLLVDATQDPALDIFEPAAEACLRHGVYMLDAGQLYEGLFGHVPAGTISSAWFRYLIHPSFQPVGGATKRAFDLVVGSCVAILAAPVLAIAAIAIRLESPGPVLYRQPRVGEHGRKFSILKLRTMRVGSDTAAERWSGRDDDRVTKVGRWLRAWHLDEVPQLWNVLRGEMTLVGPRPEQCGIVAELEQKLPYYERRLLIRPGITGWAQVRCGYGGSEAGTAWKLCHDLYYLKRRSLFTDCLVLLETFRAAGHGAQYGREAPDPQFIFGRASAG